MRLHQDEDDVDFDTTADEWKPQLLTDVATDDGLRYSRKHACLCCLVVAAANDLSICKVRLSGLMSNQINGWSVLTSYVQIVSSIIVSHRSSSLMLLCDLLTFKKDGLAYEPPRPDSILNKRRSPRSVFVSVSL
jgi:hypothetical protein